MKVQYEGYQKFSAVVIDVFKLEHRQMPNDHYLSNTILGMSLTHTVYAEKVIL